MTSINKVILVGHVGKTPEFRKLPGDVSVISFPLAISVSKKKEGTMIERTEWHNILLWREVADAANNVLKKGKLVYIEGRLHTRAFEKDGIERYTTEIIAHTFTLLGRNSDFAEVTDYTMSK
jgi:single-strand DNA-binding protein